MTLQLYVPDELKRKARQMGLNMSAEFRNFLEYRINAIAEDAGGIDLIVKEKQLSKVNDKISILNREKLALEQQIRFAKDEIEKREEARLMKEKEEIEKLTKCINCGSHLNDKAKKHKFNKGHVCNACFMASDNDMIRGWNSA